MNVVCRGRTVTIEAKAPGEGPTDQQWITIRAIRAAGGRVIVIDGSSYEELGEFLHGTQPTGGCV